MNAFIKIIQWGAWIFAATAVLEAVLWPPSIPFQFDSFFFPFALIFLGVSIIIQKEYRLFLVLFVVIFVVGLLSDLIAHGTLRTNIFGLLLRWLKWPAVFAAFAFVDIPFITQKNLRAIVNGVFLTLSFVNIAILLNVAGTGEQLQFLYTPKTDLIIANFREIGAFRLSGTFMSPNDNAAVFALFLFYFLRDGLERNWKFIFVSLIFILLTQSRTVFAATSVTFVAYIIRDLAVKKEQNYKWPILMVAAVLVFMGIFSSTNLTTLFSGDAFSSYSWQTRLNNIQFFTESSLLNYVFGHGVLLDAYNELGVYLDSEYLGLLFQYGLLGTLIWIMIAFNGIFVQAKREGGFFWVSALMLVLIISITNYTLMNYAVSPFLMFLLGVAVFFDRKRSMSIPNKKPANP